MQLKKMLVDGEWIFGAETFEVKNPYSGETLAEVSRANCDEMETAIAASYRAKDEMRRLPRFEIAKSLRKIADGIEARKEEFARTIAEESAKPISTAMGEVERGIATFAWAAGEAERFAGEVVPVDTIALGKDRSAYTEWIPRGVIYGITPFNFPLNLVGHKVAPALAAKNSIIIKPSEKTPLTAMLLGEVFMESGLPKSALQIIPFDVENIDLIYVDDRISMISFTGSDTVGWKLKEKAQRKAVALELGGNAPVIVDESANLKHSLDRTTMGAFAYAGQVCISVQRVYVHDKIFDEWTSKFVENAKNLKTGDPLDKLTQLSVMITEQAAEKVEKIINEATANGAEILCGGNRNGAMLDATVLSKTTNEMRVVKTEAFAPVACVEKFSDFEEALEMANQTKYGLQASVFTNNLTNTRKAAERLEYGGVIINDVPTFRVDNMPYGGVKFSGFGREGIRYAMQEMSEIRLIVMSDNG